MASPWSNHCWEPGPNLECKLLPTIQWLVSSMVELSKSNPDILDLLVQIGTLMMKTHATYHSNLGSEYSGMPKSKRPKSE